MIRNDEPGFNPYVEFATKEEVNWIKMEVKELTKGSASMAEAIEGLTKIMDKISDSMETLIKKNAFQEGMRTFALKTFIRCGSITGSFLTVLVTAHGYGMLKILEQWVGS